VCLPIKKFVGWWQCRVKLTQSQSQEYQCDAFRYHSFSTKTTAPWGVTDRTIVGPGKHLKGLTLMDGVVKPEEFDYFRKYLPLGNDYLSDL
jgi:hypothetical protein